MEHSLSSLAFRGSIMDAITEAKQQQKLFVVYNSGKNPDSERLEASTWNDENVAESVSKYCVLLHILEGSTDAANFSAIYPQLPAPCITVVGYNGVQLLQSEGYVTPDFLATGVKKAWLSLQIKESTASLLVSGLASNKVVADEIFGKASLEQGSSSSNQASPPSNGGIICSEARTPEASDVTMEDADDDAHLINDKHSTIGNESSPASDLPKKSKTKSIDDHASTTTKTEELSKVESADLNNHDGEHASIKDNGESSSHDSVTKKTSFQDIDNETLQTAEIDKDENEEVEKASDFYSFNKSNDVHLNIRLPDGSSLQVKLPMVDTLAMVKNYVDQNRTHSFGAYDLAIPYPRQLFNDEDLSMQLFELGLSSRQALVVVLRHSTKGVSSRGAISLSASSEGYWATVKRMLSYVNPFSYLTGSPSAPNSAQETQSGVRQQGPNPSFQPNTSGTGRPDPTSIASTSSPGSNKKARQLNQFGSNIHTLKRDEDDERFSDRNTFWNGNSTQFGGDDNSK